jgi:uncharacterized protein
MDKYPCIKCGLCCKRVDKAVENAKVIGLSFPYNWDETGRCEMLGEDNLCKVYYDRPLMCNIDRLVQEFDVDKKLFYNINISSCNKLLLEDNQTERIELIS